MFLPKGQIRFVVRLRRSASGIQKNAERNDFSAPHSSDPQDADFVSELKTELTKE
jgi:hypothetical protein